MERGTVVTQGFGSVVSIFVPPRCLNPVAGDKYVCVSGSSPLLPNPSSCIKLVP